MIWQKLKTAPPPGSHVIQLTGTIFELNFHIKKKIEKCPAHWRPCFLMIWTIFELVQYINKTSVLTKIHDDWAQIVTSIVFTNHVIRLTGIIFELNSHIKETNDLTKFHDNLAKNVTSRVFTCFHYIHIEKIAPPTDGHVFSQIWIIFELIQ
ncbi:hypothetical protein DPMN_058504 [Dreissena polymorpha]|uniref:Uncharacterized protein n=1 Tax=Dreissena polymorpha TaxID=45954 RepID=A0A9D4HG66_DREPO|nr:hypothetical protein DPMN_058504 [Dreissena polymorpha]